MEHFVANSSADTERIAAEFAKRLRPGDVVTLEGDLGAGKTVFVRGIAAGLGICETVCSPTFTIVNEYRGALPLYHFDVYRIGSALEMEDIGFDEYLFGQGVCVVEWASHILELFTMPHYAVSISKDLSISENYRKIVIDRRNV